MLLKTHPLTHSLYAPQLLHAKAGDPVNRGGEPYAS
jgi:hypothetical protein